jgi:hypothetical protein
MARESADQTLQLTALVHEAWLQLVGDGGRSWSVRLVSSGFNNGALSSTEIAADFTAGPDSIPVVTVGTPQISPNNVVAAVPQMPASLRGPRLAGSK